MTIILDRYRLPDRGTFQIHETITINVSAEEARRKVDNWLLNDVSQMLGADEPTLVIGEQNVWRVPVLFSTPQLGRAGIVGFVDVDALTGGMINARVRKAEIEQNATELAAHGPPYKLQETPLAYLAADMPPTRTSGRPTGDLSDLAATE